MSAPVVLTADEFEALRAHVRAAFISGGDPEASAALDLLAAIELRAAPTVHANAGAIGQPAVGLCTVTRMDRPRDMFVSMNDPDWPRKITCPLCAGAVRPAA